MKRFFPKSLLGQMVLLMAVALFVAQLVSFAFVLSEQQKLSLAQNEGPAITRFVQAAAQRSEDRPAPRFGRGATLSMGRTSIVDAAALEREAHIESRLRDALGEAGIAVQQVRAARSANLYRFRPGGIDHRRTRPSRERQVVLLSAQFPDGSWFNGRFDAPRGDPFLIHRLVASTLALYILVLGALIWIARRIGRPLQDLTSAAEHFEGHRDLELVVARGPADIRRAIEAFNEMSSRVLALLDEKDRMLGAIGHDLRTPLASLRIRAANMEPEADRERLIRTIEEMSAMLEDILVLARTGRAREEMRPMDITALADALVEDYREVGSDVSFVGSPGCVSAAQPNLLRRALRNLIDNALTYGTRAYVSTKAIEGSVVVEVEDDGPGVPEDRLVEVTEPFKRLEGSRNRGTGGAGLGLAIAKAVAEAHGGTLNLINSPDGGLRAFLSFPRALNL